tara:strand:- start:311 stop:547 length:237 start_codon:yes stop_codon:yes gene_type:complete
MEINTRWKVCGEIVKESTLYMYVRKEKECGRNFIPKVITEDFLYILKMGSYISFTDTNPHPPNPKLEAPVGYVIKEIV